MSVHSIAAAAAIAALALTGCADPYSGRIDPLRTGLLGAGIGGGAGLLGGLVSQDQQYRRSYGYGGYGGYGHGGGYGRSYGYGGSGFGGSHGYRPQYLPPVTGSPYGYGGPRW